MSSIESNNTDNAKPTRENYRKRTTPRTSKVWDRFDYDEITKMARCRTCKAQYAADSKKAGTRNLNTHLNKCFEPANKEETERFVLNEGLPAKNARISHTGDHPKACTSSANKEERTNFVFDHKRNLELFAKMVIHGKIPLQYVENPLFTEFAKSLQPMYTHIDRVTVEKQCLSYYKDYKEKLQDEFFKLTSRVSLLASMYRRQKENYTADKEDDEGFIIVEAHYIDDDFKLVKRIIGFNEIHGDRKDCIVAEVERCIYGLGLGKKVLTCSATIDNRSLDIDWRSHISSVICCGEHIKVELFAQTLWEIASLVYQEVKDYVVYISIMCKTFELRGYERLNKIAEEHSLPCKSECEIDHIGRWDTALNMLRDALSFKKIIDTSDPSDDSIIVDYLSSEEWDQVETVVQLLELIYHVICYPCPTSNLLLKFYIEIWHMLSRFHDLSWHYIFHINELREYLAGCNKMLYVASILDPRFKFKLIEQCSSLAITKREEIDQFLHDLCSEYDKVNKKSYSFSHLENCSVFLELYTYLQEGQDLVIRDEDVLGWWKDKKSDYPILSIMARDILAIPLSSYFLPCGIDSFEERWSLIHNSGVSIKITEALICRCRELLMKLVISSELPFKFVENPSFVEWARFLQPLYIPGKQGTIRNECVALYKKYHKRMIFERQIFKVCISVGQLASSGWIYFREHFIDEDFNLVRSLMGVEDINSGFGEDSVNFLSVLKPDIIIVSELLQRHDFEDCFGDCERTYCFVSILGNIAYDIVSHNNSLIKSIRRMISHVAKTPNAMNTFNKIAVHNNVPTKLEFVLDNPKRWDSSLDMLHNALIYKDVFDAYEGYHKNFSSCKKWEEVERVVKLLKVTYEAVIMLSSDKYATSNLILKTIVEIREIYLETSTALEISHDPLQELTIYLVGCDRMLLVASSILDPRFKLLYVEGTIRNFNKELEELCEKYELIIRNNAFTFHGVSPVVDGSTELKRYLKESKVNVAEPNFNVLSWWKGMKTKYPVLSRAAQDFLAIPASSVLQQFAFTLSTVDQLYGTFVYSDFTTFQALFCLKDWISAPYGSDGFCLGQSSILNRFDSTDIDSTSKHALSLLHGGLSIREIAAIEFVKKHIASSSKIILVIMKDIVLTAKMMECLISDDGPDSWMHDEIIDCCINILNAISTRKSFFILSTSQSQWLCSLSMEEGATLSILEISQKFQKYNLVFCPIKINQHWFVVVLHSRGLDWKYFILKFKVSVDRYEKEIICSLMRGIQKCIVTANINSNIIPPELLLEKINDSSSFRLLGPQQKDCRSSDLYALKCMQLICMEEEDMYSDEDVVFDWQLSEKYMNLFRKKLVAELIFSELNERTNIQKECLLEEKVNDFGRCRSSVVSHSTIDPTKKDIQGLSPQEIAAIEFVRKYPTKEVIKMDDIIVEAAKLKCLTNSTIEDGPDNWLNDDVMNCYIKILNTRRKPNAIIVNTLHTQWLREQPMIKSGRQAFSMAEVGRSFLSCKLVFFPINIYNAHWLVGILNFEKKEFHILNSLMSMDRTLAIPYNLKYNIQACSEAALDLFRRTVPNFDMILNVVGLNIVDLPVSVIRDMPQQNDRSSCGLFALKYMELWNGSSLDNNFSQGYIDLFRKKMVAELIFSDLNERKEIQNEINMSIPGA